MQIQAKLADFQEASGLSQNALAKKMDLSPAMLTFVRNGDHDKIGDKTWHKLAQYLGLTGWQTLNLRNYQVVQQLCTDAQQNARMLAVSAKTGLGKTTALQAYHRANPNVFYCLADTLMSVKEFAVEISASMDIYRDGKTKILVDAISKKLLSLEQPLLIIDDAGKLKDNCYPLIQLIYDRTHGHAGIVLAGVEYLHKHLDLMAKRERQSFPELMRRVEYWQNLQAPDRKEVQALCQAQGIEDKDVIHYINKHTSNFGDIKAIVTNLKRKADGQPVTFDLLECVTFGDYQFSKQ